MMSALVWSRWLRRSANLRSLSWLALVLLMLWPAVASAREASDTVAAPLDQGATTLFFAEGSTQPPFQTWFLVVNPTNSTANVTFTFELMGGGTQVSGPFAVTGMSRFSLFVNNVLQNAAFATRINSSQPIVAERSMFESFFGDDGVFLSPQQTWIFADGSTQSPFDTFMLLKNPDTDLAHAPATATITYNKVGGGTVVQTLSLPPESRTTVDVGLVVPNATFTVQVTSQLSIVVEQSVFRNVTSLSVVDGTPSPQPRWFIGEATTTTGQAPQPIIPFTSTLFLLNTQSSNVSATLKFFTTAGNLITLPPMTLPPGQTTVNLNNVAGLQNSVFGIEVDASSPIVVQRQMLFGSGTQIGLFNTLGATVAKNQWLLAEGSTQPPFSEILYILNPNAQTMSAQVTFFLQGGGAPQIFNFTVPANTLLPINVNNILPNTAHGTQVVTNQPAIVERQMFFQKDGPGVFGGTDAIGFAP